MTGLRVTDTLQGDLFDAPVRPQCGGPVLTPETPFDPTALDDRQVVEGIDHENLARLEALCDQVLSRGLADDAVPALRDLWFRFRGFGIYSPCREQLLALETLANIGTRQSRDTVRCIVEERGLAPVMLPHALKAAVTLKVRFTLRQITEWLADGRPIVRALAFSLARWVSPPIWILHGGRTDPDLSVRKAALITMGLLGHAAAKPGLLSLLAVNPNGDLVRALATVADDDVIVELGRCGERHRALRSTLLKELGAMDHPMARAVVGRMGGGNAGTPVNDAAGSRVGGYGGGSPRIPDPSEPVLEK